MVPEPKNEVQNNPTMIQHLFFFTIGPVQSFIAQARKTVDLKAGSDILSKLILKAIEVAKIQYQAEIIVPFAGSNFSDSMPNKFLAEVKIAEKDCKSMGKAIEDAVKAEWQSFAAQAWKNMGLGQNEGAFEQRFDEQINSSLEIYWVFEPLSDPKDYTKAYLAGEGKLSAIKNTRTFSALPMDEDGRKCSVTGERDALVFSEEFHAVALPLFADLKKSRLIDVSPVHLSSGEGLSAVVAAKRFYRNDEDSKFDSTAGIATKAFLYQVRQNADVRLLLESYKGQFASDWDEQLLFEENLTADYFSKHLSNKQIKKIVGLNSLPEKRKLIEILREKIDPLKKEQKQIWSKGKELNLPTRTPYYALLSFDGDQMGKIWSGDITYHNPGTDMKTFQKKLAELLAIFARKARAYLDEGRGQTVYAGGDDFTGLINVHYLFEVLQYLRTLFRNEVSIPMVRDGLKSEISFSAGICVAHYKTPLGEVVRNAHSAQDDAKEDAGRNAFCIHMMKRSGEVLRASMQWGTKEDELQNWDALRTCVRYMQKGCFSNTFITSISEETLGLMGRNKSLPASFEPLVELELQRLIQRSVINTGLEAFLQANPQESEKRVMDSMQKASLLLLRNSPEKIRLSNALNMLQIADFLNRQPDHAN
jgi:CRISPR-associated protein Cmr2